MKGISCVLLGWLILLMPAHAASFDCSKAGSKIEKLICSSPRLSALDEELDKSYQYALHHSRLKGNDQIVTAQKRWLKLTRNKCGDEVCLDMTYSTKINEIKFLYPFFGVYEGISRACQNSMFFLSPDYVGMRDCRVPYDVVEVDSDHVQIKPRLSDECDIPLSKLSHEKPTAAGLIYGGYVVEWMNGGTCNVAPIDSSMAND